MSDVSNSELAERTLPGAVGNKSRTRMMIIAVVAGALLLAGGVGAWVLMQGDTDTAPTVSGEIHEPHFLDLPVMTVNLNSAGGAPEFLRLSIALEVRDPAMIAMIEPRMPRVLDTFQVYLRELRRADLEGSAGVYRLKEELHRRINIAVYPAAIENVLFKEMLVQ